MTAQQFIWWLTGFMEAIEQSKRESPYTVEWKHIKEILQSVTCWEIEQGGDSHSGTGRITE